MGKGKNKERGAIVVEASIAVPVYVFIIFTIMSITNICYAQAKVQVALNSAARHLSEISYILYATGIMETGGHNGGKSSATAQQISDEMNTMLSGWGGETGALSDISEMIGSTSLGQILDNAAATAAMKLLVDREFKTSKTGDSSALKRWLKINGDIDVHAVVSDNAVLVAGAYYDIEVINLLNTEFTFNFHSGTMTYLWTDSNRTDASLGSHEKPASAE